MTRPLADLHDKRTGNLSKAWLSSQGAIMMVSGEIPHGKNHDKAWPKDRNILPGRLLSMTYRLLSLMSHWSHHICFDAYLASVVSECQMHSAFDAPDVNDDHVRNRGTRSRAHGQIYVTRIRDLRNTEHASLFRYPSFGISTTKCMYRVIDIGGRYL